MSLQTLCRTFSDELRRAPLATLAGAIPFLTSCRTARGAMRARSELTAFVRRRSANALEADFADLMFLYETVRWRRPRQILEFGSGCSTLILTLALCENQLSRAGDTGHLLSIDAERTWADSTWHALPKDLRGFCTVRHCPRVEIEFDGVPAFRHAGLPEVVPDLLYLDGPPLTPHRRVAVDVLDLESRFSAGFFMIVDGRWENVSFLRQRLRRQYEFRHRGLFQNSTFELKGP